MAKGVKISISVMGLLLILALSYIAYSEYSDWKQKQDITLYQQGFQAGGQQGYEQAIAQVYQGAASCQQIPLTYNNQTLNLIAVECLQQAQNQQQVN